MNNILNLRHGKFYVAIVEDSPVQAKKLKYLLEESGFEVGVSVNGEQALESLRQKRPMLVISDIVMPGMNGYELCSQMKADNDLKNIPVILLTSLRDPLDIIKGLQSGADNFITKPYDDEYLLSRIQYLLANRNLGISGSSEMVIEIVFRGEKYSINSEKKQILDLLLSVYEAAVQRNDELVRAQAELQKLNEDLISANDELESFAHTVSHDLRSPLNIILGYIHLIREDKEPMLDDETMQYLGIVINSAKGMADLIEDLLNFARSGKAAIQVKETNLSEIAEKVINELRLKDHGRKIQIDIEKDLIVNADPHLMSVVLENLLGNAWKYTSKADSPSIYMGTEIQGSEKVIFVEDNGDGFDPKDYYKLFGAFQRLHTNTEFPGTGVGLATVKRIIERHGGRIWAKAEKGKGATFYFTIPK
ncbi:MAG: response regulator [Bacteroidetes bacterium]|nr:response regulator [Bacteroidota bacterium]